MSEQIPLLMSVETVAPRLASPAQGGGGATKLFRPWNPEQAALLPASKRDSLGDGHLAVFLRDLLAHLDLGPILDAYADDRGQPPYDPRMMTVLLLYAYSQGSCVGNLAVAVLVVDNNFLGNARVVKGNMLAAALGVWFVWLLWTAMRRQSGVTWFFAGLAFGLALMAHIKMWYVALVLVLVVLIRTRQGNGLATRACWAFVMGASVVMAPAVAYIVTDLDNFVLQWGHRLFSYPHESVGLLGMLGQWNTGIFNWPYPTASPVKAFNFIGLVLLMVCGGYWLVGEIRRRGPYQIEASYLLLSFSCVVYFGMLGFPKTFMDMVYVTPFLSLVAAVSGFHVSPGLLEGRAGIWRRVQGIVVTILVLYFVFGVIQNVYYVVWMMRADLASLDELSAVLRRVVPRDAKILAIDTQWPFFYDHPVFLAAHSPMEKLGLTEDLRSGRVGRHAYDTLIIDDFWLASEASTTPRLLR